MVTAEISAGDGLVGLVFTDGSDHVDIVMTADECREFCNGLGEAIVAASRAKVTI
jgi:hypothetical protein